MSQQNVQSNDLGVENHVYSFGGKAVQDYGRSSWFIEQGYVWETTGWLSLCPGVQLSIS